MILKIIKPLVTLVFVVLPIQMMADGKKVALVIGNANYVEDSGFKPLSNPLNDARAIANKLSSLGFTISGNKPLLDGTKRQMSAAIEQFMYDSRDADIVLFYYSGHGASRDNKEALLLPLGETFKEFNFRESCIGLETIVSAMNRYDAYGKSKFKIIILDACRNAPYSNPLDKSKGAFDVNKGLIRTSPPDGFAICYATAPGETAIERANERYSVYTEALLAELSSGKKFSNMMAAISKRVKDKTHNRQAPKYESEFTGDFSFVSYDTPAKLELPSKNTVVVGDVYKQSNTTPYQTGFENGHEWVDLGLPSGTKWATCNIGATSPNDYGKYYAWGETSTKTIYSWNKLKYHISGDDYNGNLKFSKYVIDCEYGAIDSKEELEMVDDAAFANWGSSWRMPSNDQIVELKEKCTWIWSRIDDHNGFMVTGPNGGSIFLPAAGTFHNNVLISANESGFYWSRSVSKTDGGKKAYYLGFTSDDVGWSEFSREIGYSVRAVLNSE